MIAEKLIWTSQDTFKTMRDKIESLIGKEVYCNLIEEKKVTIFSVTEIVRGINSMWCGEWLKKDVWVFAVCYGTEDSKSGRRYSMIYRFTIPRKFDVFEDDLKENSVFYDLEHPFIFYQINTKITS